MEERDLLFGINTHTLVSSDHLKQQQRNIGPRALPRPALSSNTRGRGGEQSHIEAGAGGAATAAGRRCTTGSMTADPPVAAAQN